MKRMIRHFLTSLLAAALVCGVMTGSAHAQPLDSIERSYRASATERAELIGQLEQLEGRYNVLVRRIEAAKRSGAMDTFAGRLELGNLLRESKTLADELGRLQERVRKLDTRLDRQRGAVLGKIDSQVATLEQRLATADRSERRRIVSELNALRRQRADYSAPLPDAPSVAEIRDALSFAEEIDPSQPEQLHAAADELQDTEDQIRRRLDAVRERLDTLQRRKRLMRRADNLSREERFFEETDRNRVIARVEKDGASQNPDQPNAPTTGNNSAVPAEQPGNNASPAREPDRLGNGVEFDAAPESGAGSDDQSGGFTDAPESPAQAPRQPNGDDPFSSSGETVVISAGAEPTRAVSGEATRIRDVDDAIDDLEDEERELSKQAESLKKRAFDLREKAQDVQ